MPSPERRDVSGWEVSDVEPVGRERKVWLQEPGSDGSSRERRWLFKPVIVPAHGRRQGEDWVEKAVAGLARLLDVPCAEVELAVHDGMEGSISRNVAPDGWGLVLGSELMTRHDPDYREGRLNEPGRPGHSLVRIMGALSECAPPPGTSGPNAWDVFTAYLMLDAWVANQDRHDQNWAVLSAADGTGRLCLAPSFDHASSLGFSLDDARRRHLVENRDVARWARRGRAHRFEHDPHGVTPVMSLVDLAHCAMDMAGAETRRRRLDALARVEDAAVEAVVGELTLSDPAASFVLELLAINRGRLLDEH